jgi:hypothetical protein
MLAERKMKQTIEIDDTLPERVQSAINDVKEELLRFLESNPEATELPCLNNDLDYDGSIHEIIDSAVPFHTYEIKCAWFLHDRELEGAYENAGIGKNPCENDGMTAIYCYIQEQVNDWYSREAGDFFNEWQAKKGEPTS